MNSINDDSLAGGTSNFPLVPLRPINTRAPRTVTQTIQAKGTETTTPLPPILPTLSRCSSSDSRHSYSFWRPQASSIFGAHEQSYTHSMVITSPLPPTVVNSQDITMLNSFDSMLMSLGFWEAIANLGSNSWAQSKQIEEMMSRAGHGQ